MTAAGSPKRINSVRKAAAVLRIVGRAGTLSLTEIAQHAGFNPSTTHHIAQTLVDEHLLFQDPESRRYSFGPDLLAVLAPAQRADLIARMLHAPLVACAAAAGFDAWAAMLRTDGIVLMARVPGPSPLKVELPLHTPFPAHASAAGHVLLAGLETNEARSASSTEPSSFAAPTTAERASAALHSVERARAEGFAAVMDELIEGAGEVAVPVHVDGAAIAALVIWAPTAMLSGDRRPPILDALRAAARAAASALHTDRGTTGATTTPA